MLSKVASQPTLTPAFQLDQVPAGLRKEIGSHLDYQGLEHKQIPLSTKRGPHLAPTTDMGRHHEFIEHELMNRESKKIGLNDSFKNESFEKRQIINSLNDPLKHRQWIKNRNNFNVITGGFQKRI